MLSITSNTIKKNVEKFQIQLFVKSNENFTEFGRHIGNLDILHMLFHFI